MKQDPRIRKVVKWGALVAFMLFGAAWALTTQGTISYATPGGSWIGLSGGCVDIGIQQGSPPPLAKPGWSVGFIGGGAVSWPGVAVVASVWHLYIPLWAPLGIACLLTVLGWSPEFIAARRLKLGKCPKCSYDRAGIPPTAPCPECGKTA